MSAAIASPANCCSPCEDQPTTQIPGAPGEPGTDGADGSDGLNSFTSLTSAFTVPNAGSPDVAVVASSLWAVVGQIVFLEGAGYFTVTSVPDSTHVELDNTDYTGNAPDGTVIAIGSHLGPSGIKGVDGTNGTGDMLGSNNLSDVDSPSVSVTNLGGSVVGAAVFGIASPSAIRFFRVNADNTVTLLSDSDTRIALGLAIGTNVQAYDADLTTWAGVSPSANVLAFVSAANSAAMRTALGVIADQFALYQHQQVSGVDGGTFTNGAWRTVPLTIEVADPNGIGALSSNEVTLQAGTYRFKGWTSAYSVNNVQSRIFNVTGASVIAYGRCAISSGASTQFVYVEGRFTVAVATAIRMEAQCSTTEASDGFGKALSFGGTEVYAGLEIVKE